MKEGGVVQQIGEKIEMFANNALATVVGLVFVLGLLFLIGCVLTKNYVKDSFDINIRAKRKIKWKLKMMKFKQREVAFFKKIS